MTHYSFVSGLSHTAVGQLSVRWSKGSFPLVRNGNSSHEPRFRKSAFEHLVNIYGRDFLQMSAVDQKRFAAIVTVIGNGNLYVPSLGRALRTGRLGRPNSHGVTLLDMMEFLWGLRQAGAARPTKSSSRKNQPRTSAYDGPTGRIYQDR